MKVKIYKPVIAALTVCLLAGTVSSAQIAPAPPQPVVPAQPTQSVEPTVPPQPAQPVEATVSSGNDIVASVKVDGKWLSAQMNNLKSIIASAGDQVNEALRDANITVNGNIAHINNSGDGEVQESPSLKSYSKTYPADANDKLVIDNSYGSVVINTWDKNYFKVDVTIRASAKSESQQKDMLDDVNISDSKNGSEVAFRTDIDKNKSIWKIIFGGGNWGDHSLSIDYTVYMPAHNELVLRNRYGNIDLPELTGHVTVDCSYGSLHGKTLSNSSEIRERYGNIDIDKMGTTTIDLSYGNLSLGSVGKIEANASYSGININKLRESGAFNIRYGGGLKIEDMDKSVNNLAVNTTYSSVNVGLSGDENANFEIVVHYGDFNYHDHNVTITDKTPGDNDRGAHTTKSFKGYVGKNGSGKSISINASYGSVQFD
jgi:hypothetical protein